ncbi:MAG: SDR family NAD(P)-dependent oxidoreductase [Pseudomonadota bacterium]
MTAYSTKHLYDVAVSGYACRLPQAPSPDDFWRVLEDGRCVITETKDDRWSKSRYLHRDKTALGRSYTFAAGQVDDIWDFDPGFFNVSPREAIQMDPQQRILLQTVWEAVEHAGLRPDDLSEGRTGVYVGASASDHSFTFLGDPALVDAQFMTGNTLSIVSNRISYLLDLKGPSYTVDTACSSSFYAMHQAVQALRSGEIDTAIVGGVNALLSPFAFVGFSRATMLSPVGLCKAFDSSADGYVRSEGAVAFVLRRADLAKEAGDPVRSMIVGSGVNSDGRTTGMAMPSAERQADLLRQMLKELQFDPDDLAFLECHGTGTPVGDPMEAHAIGEVFGRRRASPLTIGSAKTNFGHLEPASGLVGMLKAQMALEKGVYPKSLHVNELNPNIAFDDLNLEVATAAVALEDREAPWLAGVNSFGFGGANAHVVLRQPDADEAASPRPAPKARALTISAATKDSLGDMVARWRDALTSADFKEADRLVNGAAYRRQRAPHRLVALGESGEEIAAALAGFSEEGSDANCLTGQRIGRGEKTAFIFGGNGSQWAGMGLDLYEEDEAFRAAFDEVADLFEEEAEIDLREILEADDLDELLNESRIAQPILFAIQVAIVKSLEAQGLRPDAVAGHSVGEVAAAWTAGVLSLEDAVHLIRTRSTALEFMKGMGGMAAVLAGEEAVEAALADFDEYPAGTITVAGDNSPRSSTIAGPVDALTAFSKFARKRRVAAKLLDIDYPYHSPAIDPIRAKLIEDLSGLKPLEGHATYVSSTSGREAPGVALDTEYWWRNARQPVRFREAVDALAKLGCGVFVEIAPRPVLQNYVSDTLDSIGWGASVITTLEQNPRIAPTARSIAAKALAHGAKIDDERFFGEAVPYTGGLPSYAWANTTYRIEPSAEAVNFFGQGAEHPLLGGRLRQSDPVWMNVIDATLQPWLKDHQVDGAVVFPAAGYVEMALAAGCEIHGLAELSEFEILRPMVLEDGASVQTRVAYDQSTGQVRIESRRRLTGAEFGLNAFGVIRKTPVEAPSGVSTEVKSANKLSARALYQSLDGFGLNYGPAFQRIKSARVNGEIAVAHMTEAPAPAPGMALDPTMFDGAMHAVFPLIRRHAGEAGLTPGMSFLPVRVGRARLYEAETQATQSVIRLKKLSPRGAEAEIDLLDDVGALIASITGIRLKAVVLNRAARDAKRVWRQSLVRLAEPEQAAAIPDVWADPAARVAALGYAGDEAPEPDAGSLLVDALSRRIAWDMAMRFADKSGRVDIASAIDLDPSARPLLARALQALEEDGAFEAEDLGAGALADECPYPSVDELTQALAEEAPTRGTEMMALLKLEADLPKLLAEGLLETAPTRPSVDISPPTRAIWRAAEAMLADVTAGWSPDRPLNVLIVGDAPSGLGQRIASSPAVSRVTMTDPDDVAAESLMQLAAPHPKLAIDIFENVLAKGAYDVALCGDALARLGRDGLSVIAGAIGSGGLMAAVERAPDLANDLLNGVAAEWWSDSLSPEAAMGKRLPGEDWRAALEAARLVDATAAPLLDEATEAAVLTARAPQRLTSAETAEDRPATIVALHNGGAREADAAAEIEAALAAIGRTVRVAEANALPEGLEDGWEAVYLPGLFAEGEDMTRAEARVTGVRGLLADAKPSRLWLLTRGGRPAAPGASGDHAAADAALWGLGRVLANEPGQPEIRLADFDPAMELERMVELFSAELAAPSDERELIWDEVGRVAPRVEQDVETEALAEAAALAGDAARVLEITQQGSFDSLKWLSKARRAPEPDEVEIEVRATGLNFRDVMWAQGLLPEEALEDGFAGATLGMECAGVVTRAGAASGLSVGEEVIAFGPACFATHATIPARAVAPLPSGTNFETAAAVPTIFITAQYGLVELANLRSDETVLIHGGAGGVGLAAIQIAKRVGARIIATAGSRAKRRLLTALGADEVYDSRTLAFADQVMEATDGEGVDVVLNSLFGEAMERSLGCLKPFGRFVELGKRDYYANSPLGLRPFRRNLTYFGVDADQLLSTRPDVADRLFRDLAEGFASGDFTPPPALVFEADEIVDAFRLMQKSGHVGKIIVRPPAAPEPVEVDAKPVGEGAWLIVGGLGGFGLETANWLASKGVKKLWLSSRSGAPAKEGRSIIAQMRKSGVEVEAVAADVTDAKAVDGLMAEIAADGTPLKGVIHSAVVLDDALFESLDDARLTKVMKPKIAGADLLDKATRGLGLDHFIVYSSVTTLFGNPGQAAYVAANAYLESLMAERRAAGEPGLSIGWGPLSDVGLLARDEKTREMLAKRMGGTMLTAADALKGLDTILAAGAPRPAVTYAPMRWGMLAGELPLLQTPLYARVETARDASGGGEGAVDIRAMIEGLDDTAALNVIIEFLAAETGRILRQPPSELDPRRPLTEMGFDSLMAVDLKMAVEERIGATLPLMSLSDGVGLADLAKKLLDEARGRGGASDPAVSEVVSQHVAGDIDEEDKKVVEKLAKKAESMKAN